MKLINYISLRLSAIAAVVLAFWSVFFYFAIIDEINDEVDDSLEDYAELVIRRALAGEPLPTASSGSNNQYYLHEVSADYAATHDHVRYEDRTVYIREKREFEPARVISYIYTTDDGRFFEVEVSVPTIDKADLKEAIFYWLLFLYVAILLGFVLLNLIAVKRSMRPLAVLLKWVDDYRLGRENRELDNPTYVTEFSKLNEAVVRSMSHEMQTPLAVCQNRIEMLLDDDNLTEQQMGELVKTLGTLGSLSRLNKSLLLLCKIENGQFTDVETVNVDVMTKRLLDDLKSVLKKRNIEVCIGNSEYWHVKMNPMLASTLVGNLLKNAFVHNVDGGRVVVNIGSHGMSVANTGEDGPLDKAKIFTRFYHTSGKKSSTGIGLSLVSAVCNLYSFNIDYRYENGMHTFEITDGKA